MCLPSDHTRNSTNEVTGYTLEGPREQAGSHACRENWQSVPAALLQEVIRGGWTLSFWAKDLRWCLQGAVPTSWAGSSVSPHRFPRPCCPELYTPEQACEPSSSLPEFYELFQQVLKGVRWGVLICKWSCSLISETGI